MPSRIRNATIMSWSISLVTSQMQQDRKASEDRWKVIIEDEIDDSDYAEIRSEMRRENSNKRLTCSLLNGMLHLLSDAV